MKYQRWIWQLVKHFFGSTHQHFSTWYVWKLKNPLKIWNLKYPFYFIQIVNQNVLVYSYSAFYHSNFFANSLVPKSLWTFELRKSKKFQMFFKTRLLSVQIFNVLNIMFIVHWNFAFFKFIRNFFGNFEIQEFQSHSKYLLFPNYKFKILKGINKCSKLFGKSICFQNIVIFIMWRHNGKKTTEKWF